MRLKLFLFVAIACIAGCLAGLATAQDVPPGPGQEGYVEPRDFSGSYEITSTAVQGDTVTVHLRLLIVNHGASDVTDGIVVLRDSALEETLFGGFSPIHLASQGMLRLEGDFAISAREYEHWQSNGGTPNLTVNFFDGNANLVDRRVELLAEPVGDAAVGGS